MKSNILTQSGSVLIEALVALVIVAVGTFGVVKLNTVMLSGTGLSKTRAEALQIALKRMEDVRDYTLSGGCPGVGDTTEANPVAGVNASYVVGKSITSSATGQINVNVCVGWDGSSTPCTAAADKRIILKSVVSCVGVGTSGLITGSATEGNSSKVKTPTGAAHVGGRTYEPNTTLGTAQMINGTTTPDGTRIYQANAQSPYELIDQSTGKVLLTINDGSAFSTIAGRVYIQADNSGNPIVAPGGADPNTINDDNVFVLSSDASYCARVIPSTLAVVPTGASGSAIKYRYFEYQCYVSKGWWGNIGIARLDNPNVNNRVCVGDPAVDTGETSIWSRKTALTVSRGYRAYRELQVNGVGTGVYDTIGIGVSTSDGVTYTPTSIPSAANTSTEHHDFLITVINGNSTCQSSGNMSLSSPSPFTVDSGHGNEGHFYCMSGQCPGLTQTVTTPRTLIHGTITKDTLDAALTGLSDTDCSSSTLTDNGASYSYSCQLNWAGFAGSDWQGAINFQASGTNTLCSSGNTATVVPSSNSVAFTVNDRLASASPNSIMFTDVPLAITDVAINFSAAAVSCNLLGQPAPAWGSGNSGHLGWSAITYATGYNVATCTVTSASSATTCSPTTIVQTGTSLSYTPPNPSVDYTTCVGITATGGTPTYADSIASAPKCVRATGGSGNSTNYTYN